MAYINRGLFVSFITKSGISYSGPELLPWSQSLPIVQLCYPYYIGLHSHPSCFMNARWLLHVQTSLLPYR